MLNYSLDFKDSQVRSRGPEDGLCLVLIEDSASWLDAHGSYARCGPYPAIGPWLQVSSSGAAKTPGAVAQPAPTGKIRGDRK
jgi:hypothetical protein